jgi:hypothetical protein
METTYNNQSGLVRVCLSWLRDNSWLACYYVGREFVAYGHGQTIEAAEAEGLLRLAEVC